MKRVALLLALAAGAAACEPAAAPPQAPSSARLEFNRIAAELDLPFFWASDDNHDGKLDASELAVLWRVGPSGGPYVSGGNFTPAFLADFARMQKVRAEGHPLAGLPDAEQARRKALIAELGGGRPSLVRSDFRRASAEDRALVKHVLEAARLVERIYEKQLGTFGLDAKIPADDTLSRAVFRRNHGPLCQAPRTEKDPACSAVWPKPSRVSGMYPASLQADPKFCEKLEARKDQKALLGPFTVVIQKGAELEAVPYSAYFKDEMTAVSRELGAAAAAVTSPGEAPLKAYLTAASKAFLDNDWEPADEAWAKMGVHNSKWYLRVGPDETYADPCSRKAGFHVSFARINQDSLAWQKKLDPVKNDMEAALAQLAGPPYAARKVSFHLPDFIDMVLNAGDSRNALGATIGQSLPNWGPVANEGRGRTVAMTNLYTDADSLAAREDSVASLLCKSSFDRASLDPSLTVMATVLHEAAHNLGPAHEYKVSGKTDAEAFGGPLAGMLEELKAQTSSLYLADWLVHKGIVDGPLAKRAHAADILWAFGHIAQGMTNESGSIKPYSQLAAIQVGYFLDAGAITWHADQTAENGRDQGCFDFHLDKLPPAITSLETQVLGIKARGDKAEAQKLQQAYVAGKPMWQELRRVITERWLRQPKSSFVYSIEL